MTIMSAAAGRSFSSCCAAGQGLVLDVKGRLDRAAKPDRHRTVAAMIERPETTRSW